MNFLKRKSVTVYSRVVYKVLNQLTDDKDEGLKDQDLIEEVFCVHAVCSPSLLTYLHMREFWARHRTDTREIFLIL